MATIGRAVIEMEPDNQYTLMVYQKVDEAEEVIISATPNMTMANAFNDARDALAAMATGSLKHRRVIVQTRIT